MHPNNTKNTIEQLFNDNFHSLAFVSFRIVKDFDQAQDIVQNVFVKLWQNYDKVKHTDNLKSYIHTAIRNSSLNYVRDLKTVNQEESEIDMMSIEPPLEPDNDEKENNLIQDLHMAVDRLPEKWKEAFILSRYEKLKYYEIATEMNISPKTVEKYISKALMFLRTELKDILIILIFMFFTPT